MHLVKLPDIRCHIIVYTQKKVIIDGSLIIVRRTVSQIPQRFQRFNPSGILIADSSKYKKTIKDRKLSNFFTEP
jgi:hypothetical protein